MLHLDENQKVRIVLTMTTSESGLPVIEMGTLERLETYLPEDGARISFLDQSTYGPNGEYRGRDISDQYHPLGQGSLATTVEFPSVLYDDGAAHCSPILTIDEAGNGLHAHPAFGRYGYLEVEKSYLPEVALVARIGRISCLVSGSNVDVVEEYREHTKKNPIDEAVEGLEDRMRAIYGRDMDFYPLVSKQYDNQHNTSPLVPSITSIRGMAFIPRYIATDGQNHVLFVPEYNAKLMRGSLTGRQLLFEMDQKQA